MQDATKKKYLLAIYDLGKNGEEVRSVEIANWLHVKKSSVSGVLAALAEENMIEKKHYGTVRFTADGAKYASLLYTDYLVLQKFFEQHIGSTPQTAMLDAVSSVCILTEETKKKIGNLLLKS